MTLITVAQQNTVIFGLQIEPIVPSKMFRIQTQDFNRENVSFSIIPKTGYLLGAHLSINFTKHISIESGINLIKRQIEMTATDSKALISMSWGIHNFEIPLTTTLYVRLSEKIYMGHTAGISFQMLPSHLVSRVDWVDSANVVSKFEQMSFRRSWLVPTFKGGIGFEYRSDEDGYFYVGAMYHLFTKMYETRVIYKTSTINELFVINPQSDFFGILFRYSFPPSPFLKSKKNEKERKH